MKKTMAAAMAVLLLALTGCGQGQAEIPASFESVSEVEEQAVQPETQEQRTGSITNADVLSSQQQEILLQFMDAYYQSLAGLEVQDVSGLFVADPGHDAFSASVDGTPWRVVTENQTQAVTHQGVWEMVVGMRRASGLDLRLLSYNYRLDCTQVRQLEDGCWQVEAMEYSDMQFAHAPDATSSVTGIWHSFVMRQVDGAWYLTHHAAYDSAYFSFLRWENDSTGVVTGGGTGEELASMAQAGIQAAQEQVALRIQQTGDGQLPQAEHLYNREEAVAYAREWAGERNPQWQVYDGMGGNCMNFVSQCLYAGGIPMDEWGSARWYWYSDSNRVPAWTGVSTFREYAQSNTGYGLSAQVGTSYYYGETGDVILMSTNGRYHHGVIISQVVRDESGETVDYLICSNTGNYRDFPAAAYVYPEQELVRIAGWNG